MSKSRRSSFFSPVSMRTVSSGSHSTKHDSHEVSRITRKSHIKIQTTSQGCFCTLFLLVGVPDTAEQTPFPLLADRHVELREWHIHSLDAHWAAPALSESAARAAAIFKIPVSTDLALDESEPTNTAVVLSSGGNLNLIVPAGKAPAADAENSSANGALSHKSSAAHAEHDKRGYLITLVMEVSHLRSTPDWPLQVTIPVPRCLMNTFEFRISTSDQLSAKDSPIRIFPKLISSSSDDNASESSSSSPSNNDSETGATRRCSIVHGPKVKGIFTATSLLTLAWLRASRSQPSAAPNTKPALMQPLLVSQARIDTVCTRLTSDALRGGRTIAFESTFTLTGLTHGGIEERAFLKAKFVARNSSADLEEVKLVNHSSDVTRTGSSKGVTSIRTGPRDAGERRGSASTSRIPSLRAAPPATGSTTTSTAKAQQRQPEFGLLEDTTMLDDNGDLMQVAPPRGLFNHDLSFSVDHQAFLDESALADLSSIEKVKQFAGKSDSNADPRSVKSNEDLPAGTLTEQNQIAVIIDVDEALGVLPSRLKDTVIIRLQGSISASSDTISAEIIEGYHFVIEDTPTVKQTVVLSQQVQQALAALDQQDAKPEEVAAPNGADRRGSEDLSAHLLGLGRPIGERSLSTESIPTPVKHSLPSPALDLLKEDPLATPTRKKSSSKVLAPASDAGDTTIGYGNGPQEAPAELSVLEARQPQAEPSVQPSEPANASPNSSMGLASPLHTPLSPKLVKVLRKRATSDDRSSNALATAPRLPSSPPKLGVARASYGSDGSVASLGSGHKRAEWAPSASGAGGDVSLATAISAADRSGFDPNEDATAADWTVQDLSGSAVGDQSVSHGLLPFTIHEALIEVVPTLRTVQGQDNQTVEELRVVKKVICPAWPRADLDGRSVPVPSVALIMPETEEVISVWCDYGRLKYSRVTADEADIDLGAGLVLVRVELPASLRNSRTQDVCKLEVRSGTAWSAEDARKLKAGENVDVDLAVLSCAVGTLDVRFYRPADDWPNAEVKIDGFRTQRPPDVKVYLTCDDVQAQQPIKAQVRFRSPEPVVAIYAKQTKAPTESSQPSSARYHLIIAVLVLLLAAVMYQLSALQPKHLASSSVKLRRPVAFAPHLGKLAQQSSSALQISSSQVDIDHLNFGTRHVSKSLSNTAQDVQPSTTATEMTQADNPPTVQMAEPVQELADEKPVSEASHGDYEHTPDEDEVDRNDDTASSLMSSMDDLPSIWQRMFQTLFGLFWWMRPG